MPLVTIDAIATGRHCPYCRFSMDEGVISYKCDTCGSLHHEDCWVEGSGCAVLGCQMNLATQQQDAAAASLAPPPLQPAFAIPPAPAPGFATPSLSTPSNDLDLAFLLDSRVLSALIAVAVAGVLWVLGDPLGLARLAEMHARSDAEWNLLRSIWPAVCSALLGGALVAAPRVAVGGFPGGFKRGGVAALILLGGVYVAMVTLAFGRTAIFESYYSDWIARLIVFLEMTACGALVGVVVGKLTGGGGRVRRCLLGGLLGGAVLWGLVNLDGSYWGESQSDLLYLLAFTVTIAMGVSVANGFGRRAWVIIASGRFRGTDFTIDGPQARIGSSDECEVFLCADLSVAPMQARVEDRAGEWVVIASDKLQLEVDGQRVTESRLHSGSTITLGATQLSFFERPLKPRIGYTP